MPSLKPIRFGKYLLLEKIGSGGMAELYRGKIVGVQGFEKLIAIKKILPHLSDEQDLVSSFIDEAKLAALLHHQNIVHIYDFGVIDDSYFIAMEFLLGKDLGVITRKAKQKMQPLSLEYALFIASRVCNGLEYAHKLKDFQGRHLNIIHRDVSPQNIFVTYEGDVKVVDFGIAKAATQSTKTQVGMIKGKVAYMSPEQAEGKTIDHRSDIFSAGIILYEMITGHRLFTGDTLKILSKVREAEFEPLEEVIKDLQPKVYDVLHLALAKEPDQRYQSAGEMVTDLEECLYRLSMRPSARGLSQYMKLIFEEEITVEESVIRGEKEDESDEPEADSEEVQTLEGRPEGDSAVTAGLRRASAKRQKLRYAVVASVVILFGLIISLVLKKGFSSNADKDVSVSTIQASDLFPSTKTPPADEVHKRAEEPVVDSDRASGQELASVSEELGADQVEAGMKALKDGQFADAVALFQEALVLEPSWMDKLSKPYAQALEGQARGLIEKDPEKARELLLKAVEYDGESVQGYFQLGLLYVKLKEWPQAIESYQKAVDLDPESPDTFFNLGYVYARVKDYPKAEEMYGRVVDLAPSYLDQALFNLAIVQVKLGKREQSIHNLEEAIVLNPKNNQAREYLQRLKEKQGEA